MSGPAPIFLGSVTEEGALKLPERDRFTTWLLTLKGQMVEVIVRIKRKRRSNAQNRYYWGVVVRRLSEHCGYHRLEMHDALRMMFLKVPGDPTLGLPDTVRRSRKLTTTEFEEYLKSIRVWAATDLGLSIPEPNEVDLDSLPVEDDEELEEAA